MEEEIVEKLIEKKRKSKGKRRSSFADEALRLINMSGYQAEESDQRQKLETMIDAQYDFIQEQLNILNNKMNSSNKMATKSAAALKKTEEEQENKLLQITSINLFDKPKGYELLTKDHKEFLDSHDINEEYLKKFLRELKKRLIVKSCSIMKENEKMMENRQFMFYNNDSRTKRISRSSRSSFASSSFSNSLKQVAENRDMIDIVLDFFNTKYGDEVLTN
ncbi:unnamed protein product [Brachionus calyciflorus]|uniref:Uncharacterized protein n=1 Tax=Brachionus calyciflorus TaxID=104777 RepID=A0A813SV01_9BILA|nr:unnamed protein product [Brachionus calyciflorus]